MKKFLAMLLAVLMIASMSVTAFAEDVDDVSGGKTNTVDVQVTDKDGDAIESTGTYNVTVTWGNLLFKIKVNDATKDVVWDGASSQYTISNGTWDHTYAAVTVTNLSDMPIKVNGLFDNSSATSDTVDGVSATISGGEQNLPSSVGLTADPVATYTVAINSNVPTTVSKLEFNVDTIVLTIETA